jgi:transcription elongation factor S-II
MKGIFSIDNPTEFRSKISTKFKELLDGEDKGINMEKAIYNYTVKEATYKKIVKKWNNPLFVQIYLDRLKTIYINLKNEDLMHQLRTGDITPQSLAFMSHQEMRPEKWKDLIEKKQKVDANKYNTNLAASTDLFTCGKCKSKKCTYYEMQCRSADEPMTIFITCLDCGKHWKR